MTDRGDDVVGTTDPASEHRTRAFVPGHVTGLFTVETDGDPMHAGSRGAGITLSDGVTVSVEPAAERTVSLDGRVLEMAAVDRVLDALRATVRVTVETDLPLGSGFGVSGATALGTALATNCALDRGLSVDELVRIAHGAEVQAGTGLGDVVSQARGGVPIRLEAGAPPHGRVDAIPTPTRRIEYVSFDELSTAAVLDAETELLTAAGKRALSRVVSEPTLPEFFRASREFAREAELLSERVHDAIAAATEHGGEATMAMLGESVVALGTGLSDAGYEPSVCRIHDASTTIEPESPV